MDKKLGQYFLINKSAISKIIAALNLQKGDTVIEIGPGKGALTIPLVEKCQEIGCKVIAIEKDGSLAEKLRNLEIKKLGVVTGDALKILPQTISQSPNYLITNYKIVGNIPYYITGKLLRILGELENKPALIVLTIQKEVAERICAHPPEIHPIHRKCPMCGMNLLAAAVQIWAEPEIIMNLKSKDFDPPPKVDSAIIKLVPNLRRYERLRLDNYYKLIKLVFKQPRKTLLNNLSTSRTFPRLAARHLAEGGSGLGKVRDIGPVQKGKQEWLEILQKLGLTGQERPQNLSLSQLLQLSRELGNG